MGSHPDDQIPDPDLTEEFNAWWRFWDYMLSEESTRNTAKSETPEK